MEEKFKQLDSEIGTYVKNETKIIKVDKDVVQIATIMIDSYGDTVYVWVKDHGDYWTVSDGGRILFKLDPGQEDDELYETAEEIALGAGYEFDEKHCEIYAEVAAKNVAPAVMKLAQLQVAISYLE